MVRGAAADGERERERVTRATDGGAAGGLTGGGHALGGGGGAAGRPPHAPRPPLYTLLIAPQVSSKQSLLHPLESNIFSPENNVSPAPRLLQTMFVTKSG